MSIIIAKRIDEKGFVNVQKLRGKYKKLCVDEAIILIFINRIFNEKYKVIKTLRILIEAPITNVGGIFYKVNLFDIMMKYGIPEDYFVEFVATNFITKRNEEKLMTPIFYNEMILDCDSGINKIIKEEVENIKKVVEAYEIIGKLHQIGLSEISNDLREGIVRFEKRDVDGSIKFFRRVVEGFEHWVNKDVVKSSNRLEALKIYLKKAFHLLSNFGEHAGTEALMNEAVFSKEITVSIAKYIISNIEE